MGELATIELIRQVGNLPNAVTDAQLTPHHTAARLDVRQRVSAAVYDVAAAEPEESERRQALAYAEALLTLAKALPSLNLQVGAEGGVRISVSTNMAGTSGTTQNMRPGETAKLAERYEEQAIKYLQPWLVEPEPDTTAFIAKVR